MTLEEIEARWRAANPGPWEAHSAHLIAHNYPCAIISFETNEDYLATLHAPRDSFESAKLTTGEFNEP